MPKLQNKSALVTGGARGIGEAIARCFAKEGAMVIIGDVDAENGTRVASEIGGTLVALDVSSEEDWNNLAKQQPSIDIVVNNAGITGFEDSPGPHDPENATLAEWQNTVLAARDRLLAQTDLVGQLRAFVGERRPGGPDTEKH